MTTDRRPRRPHAAAQSRWFVGGLSTGAGVALVATMGWSAAAAAGAPTVELVSTPAADTPVAGATTAPAPVPRIVRIVRVPTGGVAVGTAPVRATPAPVSAAPTTRPAPPAPVARSSSS